MGCSGGRGVTELISGAKVALRPLTEEDIKIVTAWNEDEEIKGLIGWDSKGHFTHDEWYRRMINGRNSKIFGVWTKDGQMIGDIGLAEISWRAGEAELIIRIANKDYWNQGYGRDAVSALVAFAFNELGLKRIYLRVYRDNIRAIKCYESCGFAKEGFVSRSFDSGTKTVYLMSIERRVSQRSGRPRRKGPIQAAVGQ